MTSRRVRAAQTAVSRQPLILPREPVEGRSYSSETRRTAPGGREEQVQEAAGGPEPPSAEARDAAHKGPLRHLVCSAADVSRASV